MARVFNLIITLMLALQATLPIFPQSAVTFQKPDNAVMNLVDVPNPPVTMVDAHGRTLLLLKRDPFLRLEDLTQPELRLAGLRIDPNTHGQSRIRPYTGITLQEIASKKTIAIHGLPSDIRIMAPSFSPDGKRFACVQRQPDGLVLWVIDLKTGIARALTGPQLSAVMGPPYVWASDGQSLFVRVRPKQDAYREEKSLPQGPAVQEALGVPSPGRTLQDLLKNPADEAKFSFYATHMIQRVTLEGKQTNVLAAAIYHDLLPSPDGRFLLVSEIHRPFSYQFALNRFPMITRIVDISGKPVAVLADKPLRDRIPTDNDAVEDGRRDFNWRDDTPATITWIEAQDGGNPATPAEFRDALYQMDAPFTATPSLVLKVKYRFGGISWGNAHLAIAEDTWWKTRHATTYVIDPSQPGGTPRTLFDRSFEDVYSDPGTFVTRPNALNRWILAMGNDGQTLYLKGEGCCPEGNRPFFDAFDVKTTKTQRLWQAEGKTTYESVVFVLDPFSGVLITSIEGPSLFPNLYRRTIGKNPDLTPLTSFANPYKALEAAKKETIHYTRGDGVTLSANLILPPGYDPIRDGRLPVLMEAYPLEYKDANAAGQLRESPYVFTQPYWGSPVYWVMRGYAVLENTQFPIVGQGDAEPNDTYITQLVANAKAAIDEVARRGVGDSRRVACMGHSYGAFMVANLLAHSDLFAAGIARSGAYNRTLTPFGFQSEERTYWQAPSVYYQMSPFNFADKIKTPLLMIHGDADNNPGTFTLQSERLFQAIKGLGGRARLVLLPLESHSYTARENILHMLWEQDSWLEKYVKNAGK